MNTLSKIFIVISGTAAISAIVAAVCKPRSRRALSQGKKRGVMINCNLTPEEYDRICGEFCLKPDNVMMEYIYRRGGERFGVRLAPGKLRTEDIVSMFTMPIMKERIPKVLRRKGSYPSSDSKVVKASSFTPSAQRGRDYKIHIFNVDGYEYMEIEKPKTENIGIFLHS